MAESPKQKTPSALQSPAEPETPIAIVRSPASPRFAHVPGTYPGLTLA